ncbi:putative LRR containing protein [Trachipleistophora hominis]|uniref:Putative LRR containing protein n=1 Tax=Trachipleistophora hominis TaxID=72359 RepID=L7JVY7_TRAHO|nr:putative LRR containing protein [Trachipleistophora hominis]
MYTEPRKADDNNCGIKEKVKLLNGIVNVLIQPIFNVRAQNTLETLGLLEFRLDESNINILGGFVVLTKICVSYEMIDTIFLSSIPRNVRQLEVLRNLNTSEYFNECCILSNYQCIKLLSELKCIEELTVEGHFLRRAQNFQSFPPNLKHLKVSYFDYYESCYESNNIRFVLNKLTLLMYHNEESRVKWDDVERRIRIDEMLTHLSRYIELDKLEELIVEDGENEPYHYFPSKR